MQKMKLDENYAEQATFFVEEFVAWAHSEKIRFTKEGNGVGPMTILDLYSKVLDQRQTEMDQRIEACRQANVCVSCGEPGFPYCLAHQDVDEEEMDKMFPVSPDEGPPLLEGDYSNVQ